MNYKRPNILIVDNYDSFTYNLVQLIREDAKCDFDVIRNDKINIAYTGHYDGFLFSPGPGIPAEAPVMSELLRLYCNERSFLGICLGHQAIAEAYGMKLVNLNTVRHGLKAMIRIIKPYDYIFDGIPSEFSAGLYHSWGVCFESNAQESCSDLRITALSNDGIIMALAHVRYNIRGVQFHPESFMSEYGALIVQNWIKNLSCRSDL